MSARQDLKILFCHDTWHNKNKPRISVLVERARENHQPVLEDKVLTGKEAVGAVLGIKYPLSLDYIPD